MAVTRLVFVLAVVITAASSTSLQRRSPDFSKILDFLNTIDVSKIQYYVNHIDLFEVQDYLNRMDVSKIQDYLSHIDVSKILDYLNHIDVSEIQDFLKTIDVSELMSTVGKCFNEYVTYVYKISFFYSVLYILPINCEKG